eukprot:TRINITY_DN59156_c0_g1_i1.p1 TRINITY_DN59156_c0_g1~~TRINITY_DN59156_c0_g1_i1.p1  ORF type:complete len:105 (-),score=15.61 TRINITY_DN59156_c0_g1_i1:89-403(-)
MRAISKSLCLIALLSVPTVSQAQVACAARDTVVERLAANYGESFQGGGLQSETKIFEVWFSEDEGTWTILMTRPDGTSCVMAPGTAWRAPPSGDKVPVGIPGQK